MPLRELLLASYHFPPMGGSGVQRAAKLARYLPDAGWRAHVLSAGHRHHPLRDETLMADTPQRARIHRVDGREPAGLASTAGRWLGRVPGMGRRAFALEQRLYWRLDRWMRGSWCGEPEELWLPAAMRRAQKLIDGGQIEAVVTTSPPHSVHVLGAALKRTFGLPWIADLRDPITDNFAYVPESLESHAYWRTLEAEVVERADHVVVTCPELIDKLAARYRHVPRERFGFIPNGFDPADAPTARGDEGDGTRFDLAYVGAFYRQQSIEPLLAALRMLRAARQDVARDLRLTIAGSVSAQQQKHIRPADAAFVKRVGYLSHVAAIELMRRADALLLMTPANDGGRLCIPSKTFEYLAFGGPILACVHPHTELARILAAAGNVRFIEDHRAYAIGRAIERVYDAWRSGEPAEQRDAAVVSRYRRDVIARRFAGAVQRCVDGAGQPLGDEQALYADRVPA